MIFKIKNIFSRSIELEEITLNQEINKDKLKPTIKQELKKYELENNKKWIAKCNNKHCARGIQTITKPTRNLQIRKGYDILNNKIEKHNLTNQFLNEEIEETISSLKNKKVLVQAGHYIPNLYQPDSFAKQPEIALKKGYEIAKQILENKNVCDVALYINDLKMNNNARSSFYDSLVLPNKVITEYNKLLQKSKNHKPKLIVFGEKQLANKMLKELKKNDLVKRKKTNQSTEFQIQINKNNHVTLGYIGNNESSSRIKCDAACAYLPKISEKLSYDLLINIFPICARDGVEQVTITSNKLFAQNQEVINIYTTNTCWADAKKMKYILPKKLRYFNEMKSYD